LEGAACHGLDTGAPLWYDLLIMAALPQAFSTPDEYLALDRAAEFKSEYHAGLILAMAGASEAHNIISLNVAAELRARLRCGPCRPFSADLRVRVGEADLYAYPDVVVVRGERQYADGRRDVLLNPTLIVEVLSSTTEAYDRGEKFKGYQTLESLQEYLLIAQDQPHVEQYTRQADGRWTLSEAADLAAVLHLSSIGCVLVLTEVYDGVDFAPVPRPADGAR
jgi:Uma2 family endonuclease